LFAPCATAGAAGHRPAWSAFEAEPSSKDSAGLLRSGEATSEALWLVPIRDWAETS
jgi:hypothetical protein